MLLGSVRSVAGALTRRDRIADPPGGRPLGRAPNGFLVDVGGSTGRLSVPVLALPTAGAPETILVGTSPGGSLISLIRAIVVGVVNGVGGSALGR